MKIDSKGNIIVRTAAILIVSLLLICIFVAASINYIQNENIDSQNNDNFKYIVDDYTQNLEVLAREAIDEATQKVFNGLPVLDSENQIKKNCIDGAPDFVVEVLSPSTKRRDVTIKKEVYEKFGVKEYWIINPADESIETYILKNNKFILDNIYHNFDEEDWAALTEAEKAEQQLSLKISMYPDLEIMVKDVFAT